MTGSLFQFAHVWLSPAAWWRRAFGKPDGWMQQFRCWLHGGHAWQECDPDCCEGAYCVRCLATKFTWFDGVPPRGRDEIGL